jgi:hypothetical protein
MGHIIRYHRGKINCFFGHQVVELNSTLRYLLSIDMYVDISLCFKILQM